jgi:hypothetical protein
MCLETVKTLGPFGAGAVKPVVCGEQAFDPKKRGASLAAAPPIDEAGALKHLEVLGDCWLCQSRPRGKFDNAGLARRKALENRPASGVGKGREGPAKGVVCVHYQQFI